MTLVEILDKLRRASVTAIDFKAETALRDASDEVYESAIDFDPDTDLPAGLRRMTSAISRAQKLYSEATGKVLVEPQMTGTKPAKPKRRTVSKRPPEPPMAA